MQIRIPRFYFLLGLFCGMVGCSPGTYFPLQIVGNAMQEERSVFKSSTDPVAFPKPPESPAFPVKDPVAGFSDPPAFAATHTPREAIADSRFKKPAILPAAQTGNLKTLPASHQADDPRIPPFIIALVVLFGLILLAGYVYLFIIILKAWGWLAALGISLGLWVLFNSAGSIL